MRDMRHTGRRSKYGQLAFGGWFIIKRQCHREDATDPSPQDFNECAQEALTHEDNEPLSRGVDWYALDEGCSA